MNTSSKRTATITVAAEDLAYARRLITNIDRRAYELAVDAWWAVDLLVTLQARGRCTDSLVYRARLLCRRVYGWRPCARVGLATRPFHVARTRKTPLSRVGRIRGGHRRCGISAADNRWLGPCT